MPQCKDCQYQNGRLGSGINVEHLTLPVDGSGVPTIEICPGDFLTKDTSTAGVTKAGLVEDVAWNTDLDTTRGDAIAAFAGVAYGEVETDACIAGQEPTVPYVRPEPNLLFRRSYLLTDASGAETAATYQQGDLFTFSKDPSANALLAHKLTPTADVNLAVFKAVEDSGPDAKSRVMVEFV